MNLDEYADIGTHLYVKNNEVIWFNSFGVEKKFKNLLDTKTQKQTYLEYKQTIQ